MKRAALLSCLVSIVLSCSPKGYIPPAPDYSCDSNWYVVERGAPADLFYICSTETADYKTADGREAHHADVSDSTLCQGMFSEFQGIDRRMGQAFNFYSPLYRQVTMETYKDSAALYERIPLALQDVKNAFGYYLEHYNQGRPFILAGFSQGGHAVKELLQEMPDSVHSRMIAAYIIGWHVLENEWKEHSSTIIPARGESDTGVTICYNSVRSPQEANPILTGGNQIAINPVNWCTDATPATIQDTLTVTLDPESKLLLVQGYKGTQHIMPPYFYEGNYHTMEVRWYSEYLRRNMELRTQAFLSKK